MAQFFCLLCKLERKMLKKGTCKQTTPHVLQHCLKFITIQSSYTFDIADLVHVEAEWLNNN